MPRIVIVAAAQLGAIQKADTRQAVVARMLELMDEGKAKGADFIVYPGAGAHHILPALVSRGPRRGRFLVREGDAQRGDAAVVRASAKHGIGLSSAMRSSRPTGTISTLDPGRPKGEIVGKYRKVHLPGHAELDTSRASSTWRSAISSRANSAFPCGAPWAASSACASAMTGAGRRSTASWACRAWRWWCSASTRLRQLAEERGGRPEAHLPPQAVAAGGRLPELDVGGGGGQGRRRGRACAVRLSVIVNPGRRDRRREPHRGATR